ncbi:PQQ-binding-like beta-propeller repeat protein [Bacteroidota bacterium]
MKKTYFRYFSAILIFFSVNTQAQTDYMQQWPQFRGPFASGIVETANLPDTWNIETGENIKWDIEIPGLGHSCPVIWGDKLFISTAISSTGENDLKVGLYGDIDEDSDESIHELKVYCIDKHSGKILWEHLAYKGIPKTRRHTKSSHANPTSATNGEYVVAFFGSNGMFCYNMDGKLIWKKGFEKMNTGPYDMPEVEWGFASSPIIHEERIILQSDYTGGGFITALDLKTGKEIWKTPRDEISTWSTPNFYNKDGYRQIVVNGYKHMGAYDFDTGEEIWEMSGGGDAPIPTPLFAHGLIYLHNAHGRNSPLWAIKPEAKGDISLHKDSTRNEYIVWSIKRGGAYNPTNVIYGDYVYNMRMNSQLICFNALTGEEIYNERLPDTRGLTASGVASNGKLYYSTEQGNVFVVKAGPDFKILGENSMNDPIMASPAISDNMLFIRTQHRLVAVGK